MNPKSSPLPRLLFQSLLPRGDATLEAEAPAEGDATLLEALHYVFRSLSFTVICDVRNLSYMFPASWALPCLLHQDGPKPGAQTNLYSLTSLRHRGHGINQLLREPTLGAADRSR